MLRPNLDTARAPTTILAAAIAVADTVAAFAGDPDAVEIKWPNDVLLGGLKTSGILMELGAEATRVRHLILGIGVNLNVARDELPGGVPRAGHEPRIAPRRARRSGGLRAPALR